MKLLNLVAATLVLSGSYRAYAQEANIGMALDSSSLDDNAVAIYAEACEPLKKDEPKSSIRMRVTDKASFNAVSNMTELDKFKILDRHDLNVLVYNIVDNYVEDMAVRTTSHNTSDICLEVTGYVRKENINKAYQEAKNTPKEDNSEVKGLNEDDLVEEEDSPLSLVQPEASINTKTNISAFTNSEPQSELRQSETIPDKKARLVYIEPVEFFNNTQSESHAQILKEIFAHNENFYLTDKKDLADYVIKSKILRAKVDPINRNTNRLQMVLAVGVQFKDTNTTSVEHQNRFILFSSDESEQKVAADLMKKLFEKAAEPILDKVEQNARKKSENNTLPKIITPNKF